MQQWKRGRWERREELGQACKASRKKEGNERKIDETRVFTASFFFSVRKHLAIKIISKP
jgi:hypothetical protein